MKEETFLDEIIKTIRNAVAAAESIVYDISFSKKNQLLYNIDFSLLYPYLWPEAPPSVPAYKMFGRKVFDTLINTPKANPPFSLIFTGPSFCELLDQISHKVSHLDAAIYSVKGRSPRIRRILEKQSDFGDWQESLIRGGFVREDLDIFLDAGFDRQVRQPIQKAKDLLLKKGLFKGLGDVVEETTQVKASYQTAFNLLFQRMRVVRANWPTETRDPEDREFHYRVDSANIVASQALNGVSEGSRNVLFVTENLVRREFCRYDGRSPLVPTFWVAALLLDSKFRGDNIVDFFTDLQESGKGLLRMLRRAGSVKDIAGYNKDAIFAFFDRYITPLQTSKSVAADKNDRQNKDLIMDALSNPNAFRERLAAAKDDLIKGGRSLIDLQPQIFEDGLFEIMEGSGDPVVERIRDMFKIKS